VVQLRSALDELAQVTINKQVVPPTWAADESIREMLDGPVRDRILKWGAASGKKALILGATWPQLAVDLARADMFVSVVEDDPDRAREISDAVAAAGMLARVTVHCEPYMERQFESAGFNLVIVWDSLARFSPTTPVLKKITRELKTGGKCLVRHPVTPTGTVGLRLPANLRRLVRVALSLAAVDPSVVAKDTFLMPDAFGVDRDELLAQVEALLVVEENDPTHVQATDIADLAAHAVPALKRLLPRVVEFDRKRIAERPELARFSTLWCAKERELGRVFRQDNVR
jgi:hypothetical protein